MPRPEVLVHFVTILLIVVNHSLLPQKLGILLPSKNFPSWNPICLIYACYHFHKLPGIKSNYTFTTEKASSHRASTKLTPYCHFAARVKTSILTIPSGTGPRNPPIFHAFHISFLPSCDTSLKSHASNSQASFPRIKQNIVAGHGARYSTNSADPATPRHALHLNPGLYAWLFLRISLLIFGWCAMG